MDFELKIIEILQANATYGWIKFFLGITMLGGVIGVALGAVILWRRGKGLALWMILTFAIAGLINLFFKYLIARDRPFDACEKILNLAGEDGYSFPSGHSLTAGVIATFLFYGLLSSKQKVGTKIAGGVTICLYPLLIAFSRMVLGAHYLTDTIAGIILGVSLALISIKIYNNMTKKLEILKQKGLNDNE